MQRVRLLKQLSANAEIMAALDDKDDEQWQAIEGWPYHVSSLGRIRRMSPGVGTEFGRVLDPSVNGNGYRAVILGNDGPEYRSEVHALVAHAFLGPRPAGFHVNHRNAIKTDNRIENLEYVTPAENNHHAVMMGAFKNRARGEDSPVAKLTGEEVKQIRCLAGSRSPRHLAQMFNISRTEIQKVIQRKVWKDYA